MFVSSKQIFAIVLLTPSNEKQQQQEPQQTIEFEIGSNDDNVRFVDSDISLYLSPGTSFTNTLCRFIFKHKLKSLC